MADKLKLVYSCPNSSDGLTVHRFVCIFLLLLLPLQSFAMQGGWSPLGNAFDIAHEIEHLEGASHHHGDDGAMQYDDSSESAQHHAEHSAAGQAIALPSVISHQAALIMRTASSGELWQYLPDRVPEQPQRPPQSPG